MMFCVSMLFGGEQNEARKANEKDVDAIFSWEPGWGVRLLAFVLYAEVWVLSCVPVWRWTCV